MRRRSDGGVAAGLRRPPARQPRLVLPSAIGQSCSPRCRWTRRGRSATSRAPANIPLFEQLQSADGRVPFMGPAAGPSRRSPRRRYRLPAAPGAVVRCVGCHAGQRRHDSRPGDPRRGGLDRSLAPGAVVAVSSRPSRAPACEGLTDRVAQHGDLSHAWISASGHTAGQWARLTFPVPVVVRRVRCPDNPGRRRCRLVAAGRGGDRAPVRRPRAPPFAMAERPTGPLSAAGTDVAFPEVTARVVAVTLDEVTGHIDGAPRPAGRGRGRSEGRGPPAGAGDRAAVSRRPGLGPYDGLT